MQNLKNKIKSMFNTVMSFLPSKLPVGMTGFDAWASSIVDLTGPIADSDSLKWVIANEVMRASPGKDSIPKRHFVKLLNKYAANQIAANFVLQLKQKQERQQVLQQQAAAEISSNSAATSESDNEQRTKETTETLVQAAKG